MNHHEALGHYVESCEKAKDLWLRFNSATGRLAFELKGSQLEGFTNRAPLLDVVKVQALHDEVLDLYAKLPDQCREANLYASECGKAVIRIPTAEAR